MRDQLYGKSTGLKCNSHFNSLILGLQNVRSLNAPGRLSSVVSEVQYHEFDIFCVTESWLRSSDTLIDVDLVAAGYCYLSKPRTYDRRGGGVLLIYRNVFSVKNIDLPNFDSFEHLTVSMLLKSHCVLTITIVYRPPNTSVSSFLHDFDSFLEMLSTDPKHVLVGDFNLHLEDENDVNVKSFTNLISQYGFTQHVKTVTHKAGHVLDLVLTRDSDDLVKSVSVEDNGFSDHSLVKCLLSLTKPNVSRKPHRVRCWRKTDMNSFVNDLLSSTLCDYAFLETSDCSIVLSKEYNDVLSMLVDKHVPMVTIYSVRNYVPWFTPELKKAIYERRRSERLWRRTRNSVHRTEFVYHRNRVKRMTVALRQNFYTQFVNKNSSSPRDLWKALRTLLFSKENSTNLSKLESDADSAQMFADFFANKVMSVRESFLPSCSDRPIDVPSNVPFFGDFGSVTISEICRIVRSMKPKSCRFDPVPTWLVKQFLNVFAPVLSRIVNLSLSTGEFPQSEKQASVIPIIKGATLNKEDLMNYRPVSQITFLSKLIEKIVSVRIDQFLLSHNLISPFQSAYRKFHSTETLIVHLCSSALSKHEVKTLFRALYYWICRQLLIKLIIFF